AAPRRSVRSRRRAAAAAPEAPRRPARSARSRNRLAARTAGHGDPQLLFGHARRVLADDAALVDDEDPVGEREDLVELERDEQDGLALVALLDEAAVHVLDRADVETARRLRGDQHVRGARDLAAADDDAPGRHPP